MCFVTRSIYSPVEGFDHPINEEVKHNVEGLLNAISSDPCVATGPHVHRLLYSLFCHENAEGGDRQAFADPVARAIILMSVHPSGRWQEPNRITPILARLTWAIRIVAFTELVIMVGDNSRHGYLYQCVSDLSIVFLATDTVSLSKDLR